MELEGRVGSQVVNISVVIAVLKVNRPWAGNP
jgi:hypothetical protein